MASSTQSLGPGFRALFAGSLVTNTGDGIRLAAFPLLADQLTASPLVLASVTAAQYLPWVAFAPVAGVLVDRRDRRRIIVVTQACRGLIIGGLALLVLLEAVAIWQLCIVAFIITAGEILVDPAITALVPTLVDDEDLDTANGRISSVEIITNDFAGGPVGAAAFSIGSWLPFLLDAVSYLGSVLPFRGLPRQRASAPPSEATSTRTDAAAGFVYLRSHPVLGPLTGSLIIYYLGVSTSLSLLVYLVRQELDGSAFAFGVVLSAGALGAFGGSLAAHAVVRALGHRVTLAGAVIVQGVALVAMAGAETTWHLVVIWFLGGVPAGVQRPVGRSLQQRLTPNDLLGRVNIASRTFTRGVIIIGALSSGAVASALGVRWAFALAGTIELVAAALIWRALSTKIAMP